MSHLNAILNRFTNEKVTMRKNEKSNALQFWEPIVDDILRCVKRKDNRFARMETLFKGSYYERCKVGEPDEFDLMLVLEDLELNSVVYVDGTSELPTGFTRVLINTGEEEIWRKNSCVNNQGLLSASRVKSVFANLVRGAIEERGYGRFVEVRSHGPAVTLLLTNNRDGRSYSIDLTPAIKFNGWPRDAEEWKARSRRGWPNQKLVYEIWQDGCHIVAKVPKGSTVPDCEKEFLWRYSFSGAEKTLFLKGGHGEASSCRKQVLRILKSLKEELEWHPLKSYHLKTMLFYECEANPHYSHWSFNRLGERFLGLLLRLENCLSQRSCPHYFIRELNLFEMFPQQRCVELTRKIQSIRMDPQRALSHLIE